jgi:hypothetical protein
MGSVVEVRVTSALGRRAARALEMLAVTALVLLGLPALSRAATPHVPAVTLPATAPITEVGPLNSTYGQPVAVDDRGDVLYSGSAYESPSGPGGQIGGIWRDGAFVPAAIPSGADVVFPVSMNSAGLVVGSADSADSSVNGPFYWDTVTRQATLSPVLDSPGCVGEVGSFTAVDDTDEAGGIEANQGDVCLSNGVASGPGAAMEPISGSGFLYAIQPDWEVVEGNSISGMIRVDRSDGSVLAIPTLPAQPYVTQEGELAPDGSVVGTNTSTGSPEVMMPDGTEYKLPMPAGETGQASGINASDEVVGEVDGRAAIWTSYTAQPVNLNALLPANSGWVLKNAFSISGGGEILGSGTFDGNSSAYFVMHTGQIEVSGTVSGVSCSDSGCKSGDASGFTVLVKGTSGAGAAVSTTAVTADDGTWSVGVPPGTYNAGLSSDGSTFASTAFEQDVTVGSSAVTGVNFTACDEGASDSASAALAGHLVGARAVGRSKPEAATTNFAPGYCKSLYTFKLSASIPQSQIVDPSLKAPFNSSTDPSNPHYSGSTSVARFLYQSGFDSIFEAYPKYPSCLDPEELVDLAKNATKVKWYTYMTDGSSLGKISIPIVWNQNTGDASQPQQVTYDPADNPSSTEGSLTRVWRFIIYPSNGAPVKGSCKLTAPIQPRYFYIPGGSDDESRDAATSFAIVALWYFPFDPAGEVVPPETSAEKLIKKLIGEEHGEQLVTAFEKMPWALKFATTYALASGVAKVAETGLEGVNAIAKGLNATKETLAELKSAASVPEWLHNGHTAYDAGVGMLEGLMEEGHYPVMGAVIRGKFTTTTYVHNASLNQQIPVAETLGLSVKSTSFPDISLTVARDALAGTSSSPVWSRPLPWPSGAGSTTTAEPFTQNPFGSNPAGLIAHTTKQYLRGRNAVLGIISATRELDSVGEDVEKTGDLETDFGKEQSLAPEPGCSNLGIPTTGSTICWKFEDTRP